AAAGLAVGGAGAGGSAPRGRWGGAGQPGGGAGPHAPAFWPAGGPARDRPRPPLLFAPLGDPAASALATPLGALAALAACGLGLDAVPLEHWGAFEEGLAN